MNPAMQHRLDVEMRRGRVLIVEPYLVEQAAYLRNHGFLPASEPLVSEITGQTYQRWKRAGRATQYKRRHRAAGLCQSCPKPAVVKNDGTFASRCAEHQLRAGKRRGPSGKDGDKDAQ